MEILAVMVLFMAPPTKPNDIEMVGFVVAAMVMGFKFYGRRALGAAVRPNYKPSFEGSLNSVDGPLFEIDLGLMFLQRFPNNFFAKFRILFCPKKALLSKRGPIRTLVSMSFLKNSLLILLVPTLLVCDEFFSILFVIGTQVGLFFGCHA